MNEERGIRCWALYVLCKKNVNVVVWNLISTRVSGPRSISLKRKIVAICLRDNQLSEHPLTVSGSGRRALFQP